MCVNLSSMWNSFSIQWEFICESPCQTHVKCMWKICVKGLTSFHTLFTYIHYAKFHMHVKYVCEMHVKRVKITNILMRRWNHNVILIRCISRFLLAVCRRWFPGLSGDWTCLVLYKRLVICFARPFQLLPSACTDIPFTLSWKFFPPPPQSPTCHRLHLLIVLSSLVCRKYLLICGGFLSPPFLKRC